MAGTPRLNGLQDHLGGGGDLVDPHANGVGDRVEDRGSDGHGCGFGNALGAVWPNGFGGPR